MKLKRMRLRLMKLLFGSEYRTWMDTHQRNGRLLIECDELRAQVPPSRPPAKVQVEGIMPAEKALQKLAGTYHTEPVKAALALLQHKFMGLADRATEPPAREKAEDRVFDSGGAFYLAEIIGELQAATESKEEEGKAES